MRFNKFKIY